MKIDLDEKNFEKAETGDIIKTNTGAQCIITENNKVFILKWPDGGDAMKISTNDAKGAFENKQYTILAKANKWKIVRDE